MDSNAELLKYKSAFEQSCKISEDLSELNNDLQEKFELLNNEHESMKRENARKLAQQRQDLETERQLLIDQLRVDHSKAIQLKDEEIKVIRGQLERIFEKTDNISPEHQQKGRI